MITPYENLQQVYDACYTGLALQGFTQSVDEDGDCMYRGEQSKKCGIGHTVPDELCNFPYGANGCSIASMLSDNTQWFELFGNIEPAALGALQECHDMNPNPEDMKAALAKYAECMNLTIPSIGEQSS